MSIMFTMVDSQRVFSEYDIDDRASDSPAVRFAESVSLVWSAIQTIAEALG